MSTTTTSETAETEAHSAGSKIHWPLMGAVAAVCGFILLLFVSAEAREVSYTTFGSFFALVTTPFVLEATTAFLMAIALLTYNQWRRDKDGDDWVYLVTQENDDPTIPASITQRLQSSIVETKPDPAAQSSTDYGVLEGYLELGMAAQARSELNKLPDIDDSLEFALLKIRVYGANLDASKAQAIITESLNCYPESQLSLARTALENANWLRKHLRSNEYVAQWVQIAIALHPAVFQDMSADDPLKSLNTEP